MSSRDTAQSGENSKKKLVNERVSQRLRLIRDAFIYLIIFSLILTIVITQTRNSLSADRSSEDTVLFTTRSSLSLRGVIVRDESLVHSSYTGDGVLSYCVPDGGRISGGRTAFHGDSFGDPGAAASGNAGSFNRSADHAG